MPGIESLMQVATAPLAIGQSIFNTINQNAQNRKNRAFSREMYQWQNETALANWNRENEYNAPKAQMQRLRDAGLNPNLVYGNGADATSGNIQTGSPSVPEGRAMPLDIASAFGGYADLRLKSAQADNMEMSRTLMEANRQKTLAEALAVMSKIPGIDIDNETKAFDLNLKNQLKDFTVEGARADLNKKYADTFVTLDRNERENIMNAKTLEKMGEEILTIQAQRGLIPLEKEKISAEIQNLKNTGALQILEQKMKEKGVSFSDPLWQRTMFEFFQGFAKLPDNIRYMRNNPKQAEIIIDEVSKVAPGASILQWFIK